MQKRLHTQLPKLLLLLALLFGINSFGQYSGAGTFTKINSLAEFTDGYYVIAYASSSTTQAMNNTNSSVFGNTTISPTGGTTLASPSAAIVWKIETNGTGKSIYNEASQTYVSYNGIGNTAAATTNATNASERWSITYNGSLFLFQNLGTSGRYLQYNTSAPRFATYTGSQQNITLYKLGTPAGPSVTTNAASGIAANGATLNGTVNSNGTGSTAASFEYGTSAAYGSTAIATPSPVTGAATAISATIAGLSVNTQYFFRAVGTQGTTVTNGTQASFYTLANVPGAPIVDNATLTSLRVAIAANDNPAGTTYVIRVVNSGTTQYVQANNTLGTSEAALAAGTRTVTGLANNTAYTFSVKAINGANTETAYSATTTGTTLANTTPSITVGGTITGSTTIYGTASTPKNFTVSSANLTEDVTVTAPAGFEVSLSNATGAVFTSSVTVPQNTANNTVYIRLAATAAAGSYNSREVTLTSGATNAAIAIANSTVNAKALTISGLTAGTKVYDRSTAAPVTGVAVLSGVVNGDAVTLGGTPSFNFADANVGTAKAITITGFTLNGAGAQNYTLTLPALTGSITAKAVTIENAAAQNKVYDGTQTAVTTGTLTGVVSPDAVTYTAQFAQATAGENIAVNFALTGANAGNYTLTQPAVTANITKATPVFTNQPLAIGVGENVVLTNTAFEISNSNGALTYASSNPAVASVNGSTVTGVAVGTATLTITQAEGTNYVAGSTTVAINVTAIAYANGDYRTTSSGTWPSGTATWERYTSGAWVSGTAPLANTTANLYVQAPHIITGGAFASGAKLKIKGTFIQNATNNTTSASIHVYDGGTLTVNYNFVNSGEFTVENNGTVIINNASITGTSTIWNGTENFKSGSTVNIQNWNYSSSNRVILSPSAISQNDAGYYFGNLTISGTPSSIFTMVAGNQDVRLCENNFTVATTGSPSAVAFTTGDSQTTIGGDLIVNSSGAFSAAATTNGNPKAIILGNVDVISGSLNVNQNSSPANSTIEVKKNFIMNSGTSLLSGDPTGSKISFAGTTTQSLSIAATIGGNIAFDINNGAELQLTNRDLALGSSNPFTVLNGGTLAFNNFNVTGAGLFTLAAGGTLKITDVAGVTTTGATGNIRTAGTRTYTAGGNYTYVGSAVPQVTGNAVVNAGTITIDKTNTGDVVTPSVAIPTLGAIRVNRGVFDAGSTVVGGAATNFTLLANAKYRASGAGTKPSAAGTYTVDRTATVEFYGTDATNIRVSPNYGIVLVSGTNVGLESATEGLKFNSGGSFEVTNGSTFNVANPAGFNGGTATAVTTTGTPAITLGNTSNVVYNGTANQTLTAVNTTTGVGTEGYGDLTVTNPGVTTLGANLVYARNNFTLNGAASSSLIVDSGKTLKVGNQVIESNGSITIENNGALLQINDVDNVGAINVKKNSNPLYRLDYTLWSSPVSGTQTLTQFSPSTLTNRFYEYGIVNGAEHYISIANTSELLTPAKGYLIRMPDNAPSGISNADYRAGRTPLVVTGTFVGTPNNGEVTIPASTQVNRFTAVGNPYPSPINVSDFFAANNTVVDAGSGIYFWRKRNAATTTSYATLTLAGSTNSGYRANPGDITSGNQGSFFTGENNTWLISQGQGFFVKTQAAAPEGSNITFNNSMRRPAPVTGEQAFFRTAQSSTSRLWLNLTDAADGYSQMAVAYIDGATTGLDYGYDGKLFGESNSTSLYSLVDDTKLAIQARPLFNATDIVPVGYKAETAGEFTIELDHTDGVFSQGQNIYLRDNLLNVYHDLSEGDYAFATEAGTFNDRFDVVYSTETLGTTTPQLNANNVIIYKQSNSLNINAGAATINSINVFDIRGRKIAGKTGVNATTTVITDLNVASEVLIIEVNTAQGRVSKKVVF